jgi:hypothetical protein
MCQRTHVALFYPAAIVDSDKAWPRNNLCRDKDGKKRTQIM